MNDILSLADSVILDDENSVKSDESGVYVLSEMFEKDARRYNRAFVEEQEVAVR